jgi:hypothetical protein
MTHPAKGGSFFVHRTYQLSSVGVAHGNTLKHFTKLINPRIVLSSITGGEHDCNGE